MVLFYGKDTLTEHHWRQNVANICMSVFFLTRKQGAVISLDWQWVKRNLINTDYIQIDSNRFIMVKDW